MSDYIFIKAVDKDFYDVFINEGQLCMNTDKWFRDYESIDKNIGDKTEGALYICNQGITALIGNEEMTEWRSMGEIKDFTGYYDKPMANIFSLYAIPCDTTNCITHNIQCKFIEEFNNHRFVLIHDAEEFCTRITRVLNKPIVGSIVTYYHPCSQLKKLTLFEKPQKYDYQNEYRIVLKEDNATQRIFKIGSLENICSEIDISSMPYTFTDIKSGKPIISISIV